MNLLDTCLPLDRGRAIQAVQMNAQLLGGVRLLVRRAVNFFCARHGSAQIGGSDAFSNGHRKQRCSGIKVSNPPQRHLPLRFGVASEGHQPQGEIWDLSSDSIDIVSCSRDPMSTSVRERRQGEQRRVVREVEVGSDQRRNLFELVHDGLFFVNRLIGEARECGVQSKLLCRRSKTGGDPGSEESRSESFISNRAPTRLKAKPKSNSCSCCRSESVGDVNPVSGSHRDLPPSLHPLCAGIDTQQKKTRGDYDQRIKRHGTS